MIDVLCSGSRFCAGLYTRSKEETEAAHDLLQLSRSLPPLQYNPPSPPYLEQGYTTLIYITPETSAEYKPPLTPPSSIPGEHSSFSTLYPPSFALPAQDPLKGTADHRYHSEDCQQQLADEKPQLADGTLQGGECKLPIADGRTRRNSEVQSVKQKYSCTECGKDYATSSNLSRHKQTHRSLDSGSAKQCHICHKLYVSMPALSMHILTHTLNHRCDVCGKAFSRPWLLQGHRRKDIYLNIGFKSFFQFKDSKRLTLNYLLYLLIFRNMSPKISLQISFWKKYSWIRSHTGDKPYSCALCVKSFADRSNLRAHMQTHSPAKNFKCERCEKMFALKSYLNKHQESVCIKPGVFL